MKIIKQTYRLINSGIFTIFFPGLLLYSKIYSNDFIQRLGIYPEDIIKKLSGSPRIWLHAASIGEIGVAETIINSLSKLIPNSSVIVSTGTSTGKAFAIKRFQTRAPCIYAPLDFIFSVRKALLYLKPDILVFLETEIWPNWLFEAKRAGIKIAFVNGRISVRSIKYYLKFRSLIKEALSCVDLFSMIHKDDAQRIIQIGALKQKVFINGNAKFDSYDHKDNISLMSKMYDIFGIKEDLPVLVAGSTRSNEEELLAELFIKVKKIIPKAIMILCPRHIKRAPSIRDILISKGLSVKMRTDTGKRSEKESVIILDTIGELKDTYNIASAVFCGGSLVPKGGQNIIEPAGCGKPVLYGPYMDDFLEARDLLKSAGASIEVKDLQDLTKNILDLFLNKEKALEIGRKARQAIISNTGAAEKHAEVIRNLLT